MIPKNVFLCDIDDAQCSIIFGCKKLSPFSKKSFVCTLLCLLVLSVVLRPHQNNKKINLNLYLYTRKLRPQTAPKKKKEKTVKTEIVSEISINYEAQKDVSACRETTHSQPKLRYFVSSFPSRPTICVIFFCRPRDGSLSSPSLSLHPYLQQLLPILTMSNATNRCRIFFVSFC